MKPRNKFERMAMELSSKIPPPTKAQQAYAFEHCFSHQIIHRKKDSSQYFCLECGHVWDAGDNAEGLVDSVAGVECPNCHRVMQVNVTRRERSKRDVQTFQIMTVAGMFQVTRTFHVRQFTTPGLHAIYEMFEVSQIFQMPGRSPIVVALPRVGLCCYNDIYQYDKQMSIKRETIYSDYRINATAKYPRMKVLPIIKGNGFCKELVDFNPTSVFEKLMNNPRYETLAKARRFDIWGHLEEGFICSHWPQIKMLIRHDYHPKDFGLWHDTVNMAEDLGLDTHSPKYILPKDLKSMHDILVKRVQEKERRERLEKQRAEIERHAKETEAYQKKYTKLLAVCIVRDDITISPLQSYEDFINEGEAMHHCVATYWMKKECLILGVKSGEERLATVELSMKDFHIKQCRAACNKVPPRYDEICGLIDSNKKLFIKAKKSLSRRVN